MSKDGAIERIKCSFSLLDEGRKYTGNHRKYVIENAREICYAPETREKIKLREALGYYGHGGRQIAGRMDLSEVQAVTLPGGTEQVITNIPSNVTVQFDIDKDGTVTHSQDVLDSDTGRIVQGLNKSHVGGFSWACPGEDGGATGKTKLTGFSGFDYVLNPGFAYNRGYVRRAPERLISLSTRPSMLLLGPGRKPGRLLTAGDLTFRICVRPCLRARETLPTPK